MGSATREATSAATAALVSAGAVDLAVGEQLLAAAVAIGGSGQLRAALADDTAPLDARVGIVGRVFGGFAPATKSVLTAIASGRWSSEDDLVTAVERLGIRAVATSAAKGVSIDNELFVFSQAVAANPELELALGSRLGPADGKVTIVKRLLEGKASTQTVVILSALLAHPRGRRIAELIRYAASIVAEASGQTIATITVAAPLAAAQKDRLASALSAQYGSALRINEVVDPTVLGGVRVQIGDTVIDGSIATRITDLRLQLAS